MTHVENIRVDDMSQVAEKRGEKISVFNWKMAFDGVMEVTENVESFEFWQIIITLEIFHRFFSTLANPKYLKSRFCDLAFDSFLLKINEPIHYQTPTHRSNGIPFQSKGYLYFKSKSDSSRELSLDLLDFIRKTLDKYLMESYPEILRQGTKVEFTATVDHTVPVYLPFDLTIDHLDDKDLLMTFLKYLIQ